MRNLLNDPEYFGLELLECVELNGKSYEFYLLGVWKNDRGYYLGTDSGCSCPIPFENYSFEDLTGPLTANDAIEEATSLWNDSRRFDADGFFNDFLPKIR